MNRTHHGWLAWTAAIWLLLAGSVQAQTEAVGRVLYSYGSVSATRSGAVVGLTVSAPVYEGDVLRTGTFSLLQLRMTDGALVALKADTEFAIDVYRYRAQTLQVSPAALDNGAGNSAAMRLLRGGFRTITGVVGRINHDEYKVTTPILALGIRGTDYSVLYCNKSCKTAADGLHAKVTSGAIALQKPDGSDYLLRAGEYAFVGLNSTGPRLRLKAPEELETDGPAENSDPSKANFDSPVGVESTAVDAVPSKAASAEPASQTTLARKAESQPPTRNAEPVVAQGGVDVRPAETTGGATRAPTDDGIGTGGGRPGGGGSTADAGAGSPVQGPVTFLAESIVSKVDRFNTSIFGETIPQDPEDFADANYLENRLAVLRTAADGSLVRIESGIDYADIVFESNEEQLLNSFSETAVSITDQGFDPATGLRWGRWTDTRLVIDGRARNFADAEQHHYVYGPPAADVPVLPVTGSATYQLVGSTRPTDVDGRVGSVGSATLGVNFSTGQIDHSLTVSINGNSIFASGIGTFETDFEPTLGITEGFFGEYSQVLVNNQPINTFSRADTTNSFYGSFTGPSGQVPTGAGVSYGIGIGDGRPFGGVLIFGRASASGVQ